MHGAHDQRDDPDLHAEEHRAERGLAEVEPEVEPRQSEHQDEAGQHEAQARRQSAAPAAGDHTEMDAQLVRLRPGQNLIHGEQPIEPPARHPLLVVHQRAPYHRDLRYRPAPGEETEAQEAPEDLRGRERRRCCELLHSQAARATLGQWPSPAARS